MEENPRAPLSSISTSTGLSKATVWRRVRTELYLRSYKIQIHQQLYEDDFDRRVEMAQLLLPKLRDPALKNLIFFSDEATFHTSGLVNKQNCRIWGLEKPTEVNEFERDSPKVNVWCAMSSNCIIGPYFFEEETVTGQNYLNMLTTFFHPEIVRKRIVRRIIFQQDGAPPHYSTEVRDWLNKTFPGKWIGRRGSIEWAPRSPDLSPLDFYLWGYLKQKVYSKPINNLNHLRQRITEEIQLIEPEILTSVFLNFEKRLTLVIENNGHHIEQII